MQTKTAFALLALASSAAGVGCSSSRSTLPGTPPNGTTETTRASLHRAQSCGDLLSDLKGDAAYKLNRAINRQIETIAACINKYGDERCAQYGGYYSYGSSSGGVGRAEAMDAAAPTAGSSTSSSSGSSGAAPPSPQNSSSGGSGATSGSADKSSTAGSYSGTNTQVKGVDEADIVKNDGKNLYILHGRSFKVVNAWPANELKEVGTLDIEGTPTEMFVSDGKVVVYSQVNGASVFKAAGVAPKTQYQEYGGGGYAYTDMKGGMPTIGNGDPGVAPGGGAQYAPLTKVTVLALNNNAPAVTREIYFEGSYLDSRRVGSNVRTVFQSYQYGPKMKSSIYELYPTPMTNAYDPSTGAPPPETKPYFDPYPKTGGQTIAALEQLRAANLGAIEATQLGDWLPYTFIKNGPNVSIQTIPCEDFYIPTAGSTQGGMTEIASLDLADPAATPRQTAILGQADTVYGSADTLYVAARAWIEPPFMWNDPYLNGGDIAVSPPSGGSSSSSTGGTPGSTEPAPMPKPGGMGMKSLHPLTTPTQPATVIAWSSGNTHIHKFEFKTDAKFANYVASGTVRGSTKDQFSLDDKDGFLRVATTENRQYVTVEGQYVQADFAQNGAVPVRPNTINHVYALGQNGPWLDTVGDVGDLAPNETIYSVRFVGSRGYVVTFRQVDPLFVIDLASPQNPKVLAALKIPGFSEYMHPLDENHLLTIGRDASMTGRSQALQLQIFDVTNGSNPVLQHKFTYDGQEYGQSDAEYDHKAFTYFADKHLLAFPYYANTMTGVPGGGGGMRSSLEIFRVDLGTGFSKLGSIDHTPLFQANPYGYCGGYFGPTVRRGVFLENFVYSVSYGGVVAKNADNLAAPGSELKLPNPMVNQDYGPVACYAY